MLFALDYVDIDHWMQSFAHNWLGDTTKNSTEIEYWTALQILTNWIFFRHSFSQALQDYSDQMNKILFFRLNVFVVGQHIFQSFKVKFLNFIEIVSVQLLFFPHIEL